MMCFVYLAFDTVPMEVVWYCKVRRARVGGWGDEPKKHPTVFQL